MSTSRKLGLCLLVLLGLAVIAIVFLHMLNKIKEHQFMEYSRNQVHDAANAIAESYETQLYWVAYDYTLWDELIDYVNNPDSAWVVENFEHFLYWFDLEGFWIIDNDGDLLFAETVDCAADLPDKEFDPDLLSQLRTERFIDYYTIARDTLMLLQGATIHPTNDTEREIEPSGYFFIAKCWDDEIISLAESLTGSDLTLVVNNPGLSDPSVYEQERMAIPYKNWQDETAAWLVFAKRIDFVDMLRRNSLHILLLIIIAFLITYLVLSVAFQKWVLNPLELIKSSVASNSVESIPRLKGASSDFERIGELIENFITQKDELKIQKEKAEESDKLKSAFLANMSHEIRTPMNGILGFAELLKSPGLDGQQREKYLDIIEKSGQRMLTLINSIMDISRIESGQIEVSDEPLNITEELKTLYEIYMVRFANQKNDVELKLHLPEPDRNIITDKHLFQSVISNLLDNSLKFTYTGTVEFGYSIKDELIEFFVSDTGVGIPAEKVPYLFERFYQTDMRVNREFEGAGLGLSIASGFVQLLGGRLWVESEEGKGSTFIFSLPLSKASS